MSTAPYGRWPADEAGPVVSRAAAGAEAPARLEVTPGKAARAYRPDIDGLRAVAVTAVIAFHAQWTLFLGGFVGVDVFFVISGYLIGSTVIDEVTAGRFSLLSFYERRARRIFPALAAMLLATSALACLYLLPGELSGYGYELIAATFSFSNFFFAEHASYFMPAASTMPLLHTWSLAIEEQFYLFLPLFVLAVHRIWRRALWPALLAAALVSLGLGVRGGLQDQAFDFYMPQVRAWELLLGVLLASPALPVLRRRLWREGASLLGLVLVIATAMLFRQSAGFPGYQALAPCLGAALVIAAGRGGDSCAARALSWRPIVFIGRISYSLYLWHWPIFIFLKLSERFPAAYHKTEVKLVAIGVTLIVATLSWRYVEAPFRWGPRRPSRGLLFAMAGAAAAALAGFGLLARVSYGLPGRFPPEVLKIAAQMNYDQKRDGNYFRSGRCFLDYEDRVQALDASGCLRLDGSRPNYLLMGDSYAAHLWHGLSTAFPEVNIMQATGAGCTPLLDRSFTPLCDAMMRFLFSDYLPRHKPDGLILSARWLGSDLGQVARLLDWAADHGLRVVLIGPLMRYDDLLPRLLAYSVENGDPRLADEHRIDLRRLDEDMRRLARLKGAAYVSLLDLLCQGTSCETFAAPGVPLQFDDGHLSRAGSLFVAERLRAAGLLPLEPAR